MSTTRTERIFLAALFVVSFAIRLAYHRDEYALLPQQPDGFYYHRLAENVLRGRGYEVIVGTGQLYRLMRPPGYPIFLASIYAACGVRPAAVSVVSIVLSSATVILIYFLTARISGKPSAWIAALLAMVYWRSVLWSGSYRAETLFIFLLVLSWYALAADRDRRSGFPCIASGFLLGLAWLVRPNTIGFLPGIVAWILITRGEGAWKRLRDCGAFLAAFALALSPWVLYNLGRQIPVMDSLSTTIGAQSLWEANNPRVGDEVDNYALTELNRLRYANCRISEGEWIRLLQRQVKEFFREDPGRCLALSLKRFKKHWLAAAVMDGKGTIYPDDGSNREGIWFWYARFWKPSAYFRDSVMVEGEFKKRITVLGVPVPLLTFEGLWYLCILGTVAGMLRYRSRFREAAREEASSGSPLLFSGAAYTLFSLTGFAHHRLRLPLEYMLLPLTGWGLALALSRSIPRPARFGPARCVGAALVALIAWTLISLFTIPHAMRVNRARLEAMTRTRPDPNAALAFFRAHAPGTAARLDRGTGYDAVWDYRMTHGGDPGPFRGRVVVWTGEATYLRKMPRTDIAHEPPVYREVAALGGRGDGDLLFMRLVIGSYDRPAALGKGEVLLVCDAAATRGICEGDRISVLAELSGADNDVMGYLMAWGHGVYRGEDEMKSQIPNPKSQ